MIKKRKIAIGLCLFLTLTPFIGTYISADTTFGEYIANMIPLINLTMPPYGGLPLRIGFSIIVFLIGFTGFVIFTATKFGKVNGLLLLLNLTAIYCGIRAIEGLIFLIAGINRHFETKEIMFFIVATLSDIAWGIFCLWAVRTLTIDKLTISDNESNTNA